MIFLISIVSAMNEFWNPTPHGREIPWDSTWICRKRLGWSLAAALLMSLAATGCSDSEKVSVKLHARYLPQEPLTYLQINAQVAGPMDDLQYKWFAVSGGCEPQESELPKTIFKFSEGVRQDRVTLEVWRHSKQVAQGEIDVKFDEEQERRSQHRSSEVQIEIDTIPPSEQGGPATHSDIAGKVSGKVLPSYMIAIYARAYGEWYIQPQAGFLHPINRDNTWTTWTHTGLKYAALLVRPDFEPLTRLDMLPQTNDYVLAIDIVDGVPKRPSTNTVSAASASNP
jgi:hypothetical protein